MGETQWCIGGCSLADIKAALAHVEAAFAGLFAEEAAAEGRETIFTHKSASCPYQCLTLLPIPLLPLMTRCS